jgi:hypothetical protein
MNLLKKYLNKTLIILLLITLGITLFSCQQAKKEAAKQELKPVVAGKAQKQVTANRVLDSNKIYFFEKLKVGDVIGNWKITFINREENDLGVLGLALEVKPIKNKIYSGKYRMYLEYTDINNWFEFLKEDYKEMPKILGFTPTENSFSLYNHKSQRNETFPQGSLGYLDMEIESIRFVETRSFYGAVIVIKNIVNKKEIIKTKNVKELDNVAKDFFSN